jgi:RNA polymerase sigma factor (sigma-70 family)
LRSDEQLVALFRDGNEEAFRVIHDRYRTRLFAYTRQMLPGSRPDAEDALQDIFVRAYSGLRANDRELSLRAWLYRVAHNRCVDELRKPAPPAPEVLGILRPPAHDPTAEAEQRESLRRLIADVRRLPEQQRSALLMRELGGVAYADVAAALGTSVPAVKSLLVRARVSLAQAIEARDTACGEIREELMVAHDRGVRPSGLARRHMHDCAGCREFRGQIRGVSRQFAALVPIGPLGVIANFLGIGGGAGGGAAAAGSGAAAAGGAVGTGGAVASIGALAGVGHVATLLTAAAVTAGGAVELQHSLTAPAHYARHHIHAVNRAQSGAAALSNPSSPAAAGSSELSSSRPATSTSSTAPVQTAIHHAQRQLQGASTTRQRLGSADSSNAAVADIPPSSIDTMAPPPSASSTGTTVTTPTDPSATTGPTTSTPTDGSTSPTSASTTTGLPATSSTSTPTGPATGDLLSLGGSTTTSPPATTASASTTPSTSTSTATSTPSRVASYPSGGASWGTSHSTR